MVCHKFQGIIIFISTEILKGTAMGTKVTSVYATLYLGYLEMLLYITIKRDMDSLLTIHL